MKIGIFFLIIFFILVAIMALYIHYPQQITTYNATYDKPNALKNAPGILPNVPGDIMTTNLSIICVVNYTKTVRDVPQSLREEIFARDKVSYPQPTGTTEVDHIVPLCLGGSNSINNLFVEFAEPRPGFKEKDKLENYLCDHVCSGEINIDYAQRRIAEDWYSYYKEIYE